MRQPRLTEVFKIRESVPGEPEHGETGESWRKYHDWLKQPQNWDNPDLVSYVKKGGQEFKGPDSNGLEYRNCNKCGSTVVIKR